MESDLFEIYDTVTNKDYHALHQNDHPSVKIPKVNFSVAYFHQIVVFEALNFWKADNQNRPEGEIPNGKGVERKPLVVMVTNRKSLIILRRKLNYLVTMKYSVKPW